MSSINDENTRVSVYAAHDALSTFLSHFTRPDATWESFGKTDGYVEWLQMHVQQLAHSIEAELQRRRAVTPTDFGT